MAITYCNDHIEKADPWSKNKLEIQLDKIQKLYKELD